MMTPKEAFALVNGFLTSPRCQFQGLNEAAQLSSAMMILNPERKSEHPVEKTSDEVAVETQLKKLSDQRSERRKNEHAKSEPTNNRVAS